MRQPLESTDFSQRQPQGKIKNRGSAIVGRCAAILKQSVHFGVWGPVSFAPPPLQLFNWKRSNKYPVL